MKLTVDAIKCQGYGRCAEIATDLFELDDFGFSSPRGEGEPTEDRLDAARQAVAECPANAITLS